MGCTINCLNREVIITVGCNILNHGHNTIVKGKQWWHWRGIWTNITSKEHIIYHLHDCRSINLNHHVALLQVKWNDASACNFFFFFLSCFFFIFYFLSYYVLIQCRRHLPWTMEGRKKRWERRFGRMWKRRWTQTHAWVDDWGRERERARERER